MRTALLIVALLLCTSCRSWQEARYDAETIDLQEYVIRYYQRKLMEYEAPQKTEGDLLDRIQGGK